MTRISAAWLALLLLPACAGTAPAPAAPVPAACGTGDTALERDELYFGRNRKGGPEVSDEEWRGFLGRAVTARFPAGFTVWDARGQWRGADGTIEEEKSKVLAVFHPSDAASRAAVDSIVAAYRSEFQQEAVLRARTPACVGFGAQP
ncbi:MAG TPA: DUF3574 domain-containing protein [Gemmatimonadales bacterium]|nr:DUF3574 domain-containing protein [Gemmatimonadales bacterium]